MELLAMFALAYFAGGLSFYLVFGGEKIGRFEQGISDNLMLGKRVVVSIDEECYIFEMQGNKIRITKGITEFYPYEGEQDGLEHLSLVSNDPDKSDDDPSASG
jgi:hypothetical protein